MKGIIADAAGHNSCHSHSTSSSEDDTYSLPLGDPSKSPVASQGSQDDAGRGSPQGAEEKSRDCCRSAHGVVQGVGLEPVLFLQNVLSQLVFITSQNLMIEKTCLVRTWLR